MEIVRIRFGYFAMAMATRSRKTHLKHSNLLMKIESIIFDCDGVLIDSELLADRSEVDFLKSIGIEFAFSDYIAKFVGKTKQDVWTAIESLHDVKLSTDFWQLVEENTFKVFQAELQPMAGIFPDIIRSCSMQVRSRFSI